MSTSRVLLQARFAHAQALCFGSDGDIATPVDHNTPLPTYSPGGLLTVASSFSRPANTTPYAIGDLVANSGAVVPIELVGAARSAGEAFRAERVRLRKSGPLLANASFRVHLFRKIPTVSVQDNGVFDNAGVLALADIDGYVGTVDVVMNYAAAIGARGVGVPSTGSGITCEAGAVAGHETSLWALIEARAAYVPASGETFTLTVEGARG